MNKEKREITKLFKKWFVRRDNGNCQVLFALTELDGFVDEIHKVYETKLNEVREEATKGFEYVGEFTGSEDSPNNWCHSYNGESIKVRPNCKHFTYPTKKEGDSLED